MISFRYHLVSIIAVFLALALGIVVGTTGLNGEILKGLKGEVSSLRTETATLRTQNQTLQGQADGSDQYAGEYEKKVLAGALAGRTVAVISGPGVSRPIKTGVVDAIVNAGGRITARLDIAAAYADPQRGADITSLATTSAAHPAGLQLPVTSDPATLGGALLAYVLAGQGTTTELTTVIEAFVKLNMISVEGADPRSAQLAVVLTSGTLPLGDGRAKALPAVVSEFSRAGLKTTVAGDTESTTGAGLLAVVRADSALKRTVSTVDNADVALGQVSSALAMAGLVIGKTGQYGTGPGVDRLFPAAGKASRRPVRPTAAALATAVTAAGATLVVGALVERAGPPTSPGWARLNYRGRAVTLTGGFSAAVGATATAALWAPPGRRAAALVAGTSAALAGAYDDLIAPRVELRTDKGWRGHLHAARAGRVSGGVVKVAGVGAGALAAGRMMSGSWPQALPRAALTAASANLVNLFDLRPGRAAKVVLVAAGLPGAGPGRTIAAAAAGAALGALPTDLAETRMLGDLGANTLGALLGLAWGERGASARGTALGVVVALTAASERVSFSRVIDSTPLLRWVDGWGRRPADVGPAPRRR